MNRKRGTLLKDSSRISSNDPKQALVVFQEAIAKKLENAPKLKETAFKSPVGEFSKGDVARAGLAAAYKVIDLAISPPDRRSQEWSRWFTKPGRELEITNLGVMVANDMANKAGLPFNLQLDNRGVRLTKLADVPPTVKASKSFPLAGGMAGLEGKYDIHTGEKQVGGTYERNKGGWKVGARARYNVDTGEASGHIGIRKDLSRGGRVKSYANQPRKPKI